MNNSKTNFQLSTVIILLCLYFSASICMISEGLNRIALYIALPLCFGLCSLRPNAKRLDKYTKTLAILFTWVVTSSLWAIYPEAAYDEINRILGCIILCYIFYILGQEQKVIPWLYVTYIFWYIGAWYYASNNSLITLNVSNEYERMNDSKLNANHMAYMTFFVTYVIYILPNFIHNINLHKLVRISFWALFPLSFFVAIFTASRQVLIIQIPFLLLLFYQRYFKGTGTKRKIIAIFVILVSIIYFIDSLTNIYDNSYLKVRNEVKITEDVRSDLLKDAFRVGIDNFFTGVGAGNYYKVSFNKHFSHNTYLELFANTGILGFLIYIYLVLYFIINQYSRYRSYRDQHFFLFFIFGIIYAFYNFFYVFYTDLWLIGFFILVTTHSETYYRIKYSHETYH